MQKTKIWDFPIREDIRKEFPNDPMMQELHELRVRFPFSRSIEVSKKPLSKKQYLRSVTSLN
jgi:hypothetical protein